MRTALRLGLDEIGGVGATDGENSFFGLASTMDISPCCTSALNLKSKGK
jgi:hypothetical protein